MQEMTSVRGKTVICTIHQPSSQLFEMFHEIVLIGDGRIAFIGSTNDALEFFERYAQVPNGTPFSRLVLYLVLFLDLLLKVLTSTVKLQQCVSYGCGVPRSRYYFIS